MLDQHQTAGVESSAAPAVPFSRPVRHRRIAIVGFGHTAMSLPVDDPGLEIWAMNGFWRVSATDFKLDLPEERVSLWLDMHTIGFTRQYGVRAGIGDAQERWLEKPHPFPVLSIETNPAWPSVERYPIEEVLAKFGRDYFTSSVAYAIALALHLDDVAEISLWGIDLIDETEYGDQRPCAEYWIGRAEAMGIKIVIPELSALLKQRIRYGYDDTNTPLLRELREGLENQAKGLREAIAKRRDESERARVQATTDDGALQQVRMLLGRLDKWERGGRI